APTSTSKRPDAAHAWDRQKAKGGSRRPSLRSGSDQPRQEPGRNLVGTGAAASGPQIQRAIEPPMTGATTVLRSENGVRLTFLPSIWVASIFCAVTITTPVSLVVTDATYFDGATELSQPQLPAVGSEPVPDWTTSVIV